MEGLEAHEEVDDERHVLISIAEMLTFIAMAAAQGKQWGEKLVVYVGDNTNVVGWLNTRLSGNRYVRHLLRVLASMEAEYTFQTLSLIHI